MTMTSDGVNVERRQRAFKEHNCGGCNTMISRGEKYVRRISFPHLRSDAPLPSTPQGWQVFMRENVHRIRMFHVGCEPKEVS